MSTSTVVVGIDGGPASLPALRTAIHEARLRQGRVVAVTCFPLQRHQQRVRLSDMDVTTYDSASVMLEDLIAEAGEAGAADIVREVSKDAPGPTLVRLAEQADLLVIGASIEGRLARFVGGSVLDECLDGSSAPVLVVSEESQELSQSDIDRQLHIPVDRSS